MRPTHGVLSFVLSLCLASTVSAQDPGDLGDFVSFSTLKANSGGLVQDALGVLPNSSLGGTLNRISALNARKPIRDIREAGGLAAGEELPASFVRGMEAALMDLDDDLNGAIDSYLSGEWSCQVVSDAAGPADGGMDCREAMFVILQLVKHVVLDGDAELHPDDYNIVCYRSDGPRCYPNGRRDVDFSTNDTVDAGWYDQVHELLLERGAPGSAPYFEAKEGADLRNETDQLIQRATGVEEIQFERVTGVPSID